LTIRREPILIHLAFLEEDHDETRHSSGISARRKYSTAATQGSSTRVEAQTVEEQSWVDAVSEGPRLG